MSGPQDTATDNSGSRPTADSRDVQAPAPPRPQTERVRLARMGLRAALLLPGVVEGDSGPLGLHATGAGDGQRLEGVTAAAVGEQGYDLSLRLIARPVDLHALASRIREAVAMMAESEGLGTSLLSVDVLFSDLETETGPRP